jgi:long-chain fatty acid transport protein
MKNKYKKIKFINLKFVFSAIAIYSFFQMQANAGGYSTFLHSTSGLGNSYAGSSTGSHDISDIYFNPAITSGLPKNQAILSLNYINLKIDPDNNSGQNALGSTNNGIEVKNAGSQKLLPAFYISSPINDKLSFNFALTTPFGLQTNYKNNWTGSFRGLNSSIKTINLNPSFAYKINNDLSFGAGFVAQYYNSRLTKKSFNPNPAPGTTGIAGIEGSDWGYGYNLGATYNINEKTKFGLGYRSAIRHNIKGNANFENIYTKFKANTTTPESLSLGLSHQYSDNLQIVADSIWTRWSRLQELKVNAGIPDFSSTSYFNWNDSFLHSLGANYKINNKNLIRGGLAFEKEAINNRNREVRVPPSNKYWISAGLNHKFDNDLELDFSYVHQFYQTAKIDIKSQGQNNLEGTLSGKYKTSVDVVSLALKKQF